MENNIQIIEGNVLTQGADVIAHQVNCQGVMGAGLALQIRALYPLVYKKYQKICTDYNSKELLGKIQFISIPVVRTHIINGHVDVGTEYKYFVNLFAQEFYGRVKRYTDYEALTKCLTSLRDRMITKNLTTLALPYGLGCGLAGGDWKVVYEIIRDVFENSDITIYICKKEV
jgi:O-acetyl-ADP-ribose deacetylase (regulator of RNase III)